MPNARMNALLSFLNIKHKKEEIMSNKSTDTLKQTDKITQRSMILKALKAGRTITWLDAVNEFGCSKLSTRIGEMERAGMAKVKRGWLTTDTGKTVRTYKIDRSRKKS
jgi:hypothetical protein